MKKRASISQEVKTKAQEDLLRAKEIGILDTKYRVRMAQRYGIAISTTYVWEKKLKRLPKNIKTQNNEILDVLKDIATSLARIAYYYDNNQTQANKEY